ERAGRRVGPMRQDLSASASKTGARPWLQTGRLDHHRPRETNARINMPCIQLQIPADPDTAGQREDELKEMGSDAVSMEDAADQPLYEPDPGTTPLWSQTTVTGLFQSDRNIDQLCSDIRDAWHQQTQQSLADIEVTLVEDKDWERACLEDFHPLRFGERLWIVPSWHDAPDPEAANLMLDPGLAFGTGTHPTTA